MSTLELLPGLVGDAIERWADVSECWRFRFLLGRRWAPGPRVLWVMLNPSTADATIDDPTIRKCVEFSKRAGAASLEVVNLYPFRATDPAALKAALRAMADVEGGPMADSVIVEACERADVIVAAWGAHASHKRVGRRAADVQKMLARPAYRGPLRCLGMTKDGHPQHPLLVPYAQPLVPYGGAW